MSIDTDMNISPVLGTQADDVIRGTGRSEVISGASGNDTITALSGNDEVFGGTGNDTLYGQGGNDIMYGNGKPAYCDMNDFVVSEAVTAEVTFIDEGAGFRNALGVYEIMPDGSISNSQILFANASKAGSGGSLQPGVSSVEFDVSAGARLGFFVVSNGYGKGQVNREALESQNGSFEFRTRDGQPANISSEAIELWFTDGQTGEETHIRSQYGYDIFHSIGNSENGFNPNPDSYSHVVGRANSVTGEMLIGFEDLYGGGDNDYDDTVIRVNLGQQNIVNMLPERGTSSGSLPDDDIIYGGDGDDTMFGISGDDYMSGGNGNDELSGNSGDDILYGNSGSDTLTGNSGNDTISGGDHNDELFGNSGDDDLSGDGGDDLLEGGSGADKLDGGSGNDTLSGGSGDDEMHGGSGNDKLNGNSGDDILKGESGSDELNGHSGNDVIFGGDGQDKVIGGGGDDELSGGAHNDKVYGGSGSDTLRGDEGNDYLTAGSGDDFLYGGEGDDKLRGGSGKDTFVIDLLNWGKDRIYDFDVSEELIDISSVGLSLADFTVHDAAFGVNLDYESEAYGLQSISLKGVTADELSADNFIEAVSQSPASSGSEAQSEAVGLPAEFSSAILVSDPLEALVLSQIESQSVAVSSEGAPVLIELMDAGGYMPGADVGETLELVDDGGYIAGEDPALLELMDAGGYLPSTDVGETLELANSDGYLPAESFEFSTVGIEESDFSYMI